MVAVRRITVDTGPLNNARLKGIATSTDGTAIYVTVTGPTRGKSGVLAVPAF